MVFFSAIMFEITMYFLFITTTALAINRHGKNVLLVFCSIILMALFIEIKTINEGGYEYFSFLISLFGYPFVIPLAWCVLFFWVHTFAEGFIEWDGTLTKTLGLAIITGMIIGSMSLFFEPAGQISGWWEYKGSGNSGITFFGVHADALIVYFFWGALIGLIFRFGMYMGWLNQNDYKPPFLAYYPSICSIIVLGLLCVNILNKEPILIFLFFGNYFLFPFTSIIKQIEDRKNGNG